MPTRLATDLADNGADRFHGLLALLLGGSGGALGFFLGRLLSALGLLFGGLGGALLLLGCGFGGPIGFGGLLLLELGALLFQLGALGGQGIGLGGGSSVAASAAPMRHSGGSTFARSTTHGWPSSFRSDTSASPVPSSSSASAESKAGFSRKADAAARTAFCSAGV